MSSLYRWIALSGLAALPGGGLVEPGLCTTEARAGIVVHVADSVTGSETFAGLEGTLVDPPYDESMIALEAHLVGAFERVGVYTVEVRAEGYQPWSRAGVAVRAGSCHVRSVELEARLVPEP